ncbi:MAG TPA: hypothetical protein VGJ70_24110, partial [Solirubrobacteraceae bacterium]
MAFSGSTAWVINHRDRVLSQINLAATRPKQLAVIPGDAPERMVWSSGRLWITGRGTDLLKVDPASGASRSRPTASTCTVSSRATASSGSPTTREGFCTAFRSGGCLRPEER